MTQVPNRVTRLGGKRLVATLEKMSNLASKPVEPIGKCGLQPLHPRHQVSERCFQNEVVVIAHHYERVQLPATPVARFEQAGFERAPGPCFRKYPRPVVAAIQGVITGAGIFEP